MSKTQPRTGFDPSNPTEEQLLQEEQQFHKYSDIKSFKCLQMEDRDFYTVVLSRPALVESAYIQALRQEQATRKKFCTSVEKGLEATKLPLTEYLQYVQNGLGRQEEMIRLHKDSMSLSTLKRVENRIDCMREEIEQIEKQLAVARPPQSAQAGSVRGSPAPRSPTEIQRGSVGASPEPRSPTETQNVQNPSAVLSGPYGVRDAAQIRVNLQLNARLSQQKLEAMNKRIIQYLYWGMFRSEIGNPISLEMQVLINRYRVLFRNTDAITPLDYKEVMQNLPVLTMEEILGYTVGERRRQLAEIEFKASQNLRELELLEFPSAEIRPTETLLKAIKLLKENDYVPVPLVAETPIEKSNTGPRVINRLVDSADVVRISVDKITGMATQGRKFFAKLSVKYNENVTELKTDPVKAPLRSKEEMTISDLCIYCHYPDLQINSSSKRHRCLCRSTRSREVQKNWSVMS